MPELFTRNQPKERGWYWVRERRGDVMPAEYIDKEDGWHIDGIQMSRDDMRKWYMFGPRIPSPEELIPPTAETGKATDEGEKVCG